MGLMARAKGTPIIKWSSMRWPETGWAPPPVVSPMIVARFRFFRLQLNSSAPEKPCFELKTQARFLRIASRWSDPKDKLRHPGSAGRLSLDVACYGAGQVHH